MPTTNNDQSPEIVSQEDIYKDKNVLAFIIDGEVLATFVCDERFSAILQSNPEVIDVTSRNPFFNGPFIGWKYDGKDFTVD